MVAIELDRSVSGFRGRPSLDEGFRHPNWIFDQGSRTSSLEDPASIADRIKLDYDLSLADTLCHVAGQ